MLILAQNRTVLVNMDRINSIVVHNLGDNKFRILTYYGNKNTDCWGIGDYETEERAKEILLEIMGKYAQYFHRHASPAMLRGSSDISEAIFVFPKVYEMPER